MDDQEVINEFLIESNENLARLDQEMVELEQRPKDTKLLASVFRTIHTIKGTCGFLGFEKLEAIAHVGESLLSRLRDGELDLTPNLVTLILQVVDATKRILISIEATGTEGGENHDELLRHLKAACGTNAPAPPAPPAQTAAAAPAPAIAPPAVALPAAAPAPAATAPAIAPPAAMPPADTAPVAPSQQTAEPPRETEGAGAPAELENLVCQKATALSDSTIRVDVGLLDKL